MPQIDGMTQESLSKFLEDMRILHVWYYDDPQAIHMLVGEERGPPTALLAITAQDEGVLGVTLQGAGSTDGRPQEDVPTLEEYPF